MPLYLFYVYRHNLSLYFQLFNMKITYIALYCFSCWLTVDGGLIWAFVGPALLIILVSFRVFFTSFFSLLQREIPLHNKYFYPVNLKFNF